MHRIHRGIVLVGLLVGALGCNPGSGAGDGGLVDGAPAADGGSADAGTCTPACGDRICGPDGCGGICGTCGDTEVCTGGGRCAALGGACGDGTCEGAEDCTTCPADCGACCGDGVCNPAHQETCATCLADCACAAGSTCDPVDGVCVPDPCEPACDGRGCGDDGCGGTCGACAGETRCDAQGQCVAPPESCGDATCDADEDCATCAEDCGPCACEPMCAGRACGDDGCGGDCGACPDGADCRDGACVGGGNAAPIIDSVDTDLPHLDLNGTISLTIVARDPDGADDLGGGVLQAVDGGVFGPLLTPGGPGVYTFALTWEALRARTSIEFERAGVATVQVVVLDQAGARTTADVEIPLRCQGIDACDGRCLDWQSDADNCGGCGVVCEGINAAPRCAAGVCASPCADPAREQVCDGACLPVDTVTRCGDCDTRCVSDDAGAIPVCDANRDCVTRETAGVVDEADAIAHVWPAVPAGGSVSHTVTLDGPAILTGMVVTPAVAMGMPGCDPALPRWRLWEVVDGAWYERLTQCAPAGRWQAQHPVDGGTWVFEAINPEQAAADLTVLFEAVRPGPRPTLPVDLDGAALINTPDERNTTLIFDVPEHGGYAAIRSTHCWADDVRYAWWLPDGTLRDDGLLRDRPCGEVFWEPALRAAGAYRFEFGFERALFGAIDFDFWPTVAKINPDEAIPGLLTEERITTLSGRVRGFDPRELPVRLLHDLHLDLGMTCGPGDLSFIIDRVEANGDRRQVAAWDNTYEDWGAWRSWCPDVEPIDLSAGDYIFEIRRGSVDREGGEYELQILPTILPEPPPPPEDIEDGVVVGDTDLRLPALREREGEFVDFRVRQRARVTGETNDGAGGCPGGTFMILFDDNSSVVAQDNSSGPGPCARISRILEPGDYRFAIRSDAGNLPAYVLQIRYTLP